MTVPYGHALELQIAMVALLNASADLKTLIGTTPRIYQPNNIPAGATYPYIVIGEDQVVPDLAQDLDGSEVFVTVHVWSKASGLTEAKKIGATIKATLCTATPPTLTENRCLLFEVEDERNGETVDATIVHRVHIFRALVETR
jgi:hypothetical protein